LNHQAFRFSRYAARISVAHADTQANHNVEPWQIPLPGAECFPEHTFNAIAVYCPPLDFARDH